MTLITPENSGPKFDEQIERIRQVLKDLEQQMPGLAQQARAGEVDMIKEAGKTTTEVRQWMRLAFETEKAIDEYSKRDAGIENGYALDLAEARRAIGCRMARIRPCCQAD